MQQVEIKRLDIARVSYDEAPIAELLLAGVEYRVDVGQGAAVAVSRRDEGQWSWQLLTEARWDGTRLRCKGLDHDLREALARCLAEAARNQEDPA